ncbi:hypothetical protein HKK72_31625 [Actinomadura sp. HBU206391]|nr:hypothetical protein [Actinomadura sp. HBU206391]
MRLTAWAAAFVSGLVAIFLVQTWLWWQQEPISGGTGANGLWARHQWVGERHTEAEYRALADTVRQNRITDVFFHAGPFEADGTVPPAKYTNARNLIEAMRRLAPGVRSQAYLGQIRRVGGHGILDLDSPEVRRGVLATDKIFLDLGFDGIHYDVEPVYPDDDSFVRLLDDTRALTRARGRVLSVALEQLTLVDAAQPVYRALIPRGGGLHYPARPTEDFLRTVADRVDQVTIMTYDVSLPTRSLVGRHFAWHTERTLRLIGDRVTVFMGVPTYRPLMDWAEDLEGALRGVRRGVDALDRRPARPYGVGIYAEWTTSPADWARYRADWLNK